MLNAMLLFLDIGGPEMMFILVVALLLFGGNKLPELARGLGKGIRDFKDAADGVKEEFHSTINKLDEPKTGIQSGNSYDSNSENKSAVQSEYGSEFAVNKTEIQPGLSSEFHPVNNAGIASGIIIGSHEGASNEFEDHAFQNPNGYSNQRLVDSHSNPYPGHSDSPEHSTDFNNLSNGVSEVKKPLIQPATNTVQYDNTIYGDNHLKEETINQAIAQPVDKPSEHTTIDLKKPGSES